jgi:hypothetical protein
MVRDPILKAVSSAGQICENKTIRSAFDSAHALGTASLDFRFAVAI